MSNSYSTKKSSYSHLLASEGGEISAYLKMGKKAAEMAGLLGRHRSTILRDIKRGSIKQAKMKTKERTYDHVYSPDTAQLVYETNRQKSTYCKLDLVLGKKTKNQAVLLTLVERQTPFAVACKLPNKQDKTINQAVKALVENYPILSITADNGSEFSRLARLENLEVCFAHHYSLSRRGL